MEAKQPKPQFKKFFMVGGILVCLVYIVVSVVLIFSGNLTYQSSDAAVLRQKSRNNTLFGTQKSPSTLSQVDPAEIIGQLTSYSAAVQVAKSMNLSVQEGPVEEDGGVMAYITDPADNHRFVAGLTIAGQGTTDRSSVTAGGAPPGVAAVCFIAGTKCPVYVFPDGKLHFITQDFNIKITKCNGEGVKCGSMSRVLDNFLGSFKAYPNMPQPVETPSNYKINIELIEGPVYLDTGLAGTPKEHSAYAFVNASKTKDGQEKITVTIKINISVFSRLDSNIFNMTFAQNVLTHEVGHAFGYAHMPKSVMDETTYSGDALRFYDKQQITVSEHARRGDIISVDNCTKFNCKKPNFDYNFATGKCECKKDASGNCLPEETSGSGGGSTGGGRTGEDGTVVIDGKTCTPIRVCSTGAMKSSSIQLVSTRQQVAIACHLEYECKDEGDLNLKNLNTPTAPKITESNEYPLPSGVSFTQSKSVGGKYNVKVYWKNPGSTTYLSTVVTRAKRTSVEPNISKNYVGETTFASQINFEDGKRIESPITQTGEYRYCLYHKYKSPTYDKDKSVVYGKSCFSYLLKK